MADWEALPLVVVDKKGSASSLTPGSSSAPSISRSRSTRQQQSNHYLAVAMASAPEHSPPIPSYDYSTLEAAHNSQAQHPGFSPGYAQQTSPYAQQSPTFDHKDAVDPRVKDAEAGTPAGGFMRRRVCGMSMKLALIVAVILLLIIVGAVVGGVLGSQKKDKSTSHDSDQSNKPTTTASPNDSIPTPSPAPADLTPGIPHISFSNSTWYRVTTSGNNTDTEDPQYYSLQSFYVAGSKPQSPVIAKTLPESSSDLVSEDWQFYEVPGDWKNGTVDTPTKGAWLEAKTRTFWIASRKYGPNVRLTIDNESWLFVSQGRNSTPLYPFVRMLPKDLSDSGQYWFTSQHGCGVPTINCWKLYNVKSAVPYRLWANEIADWHQPSMGSGDVWDQGGGWDLWAVEKGESISTPKDNGFTWDAGSAAWGST